MPKHPISWLLIVVASSVTGSVVGCGDVTGPTFSEETGGLAGLDAGDSGSGGNAPESGGAPSGGAGNDAGTGGATGETGGAAGTSGVGGGGGGPPGCGAPTEPCCADGSCEQGARCTDGTCLACGDDGQECCIGNVCSGGCCVGGICLASGTSCGQGQGICADGACGNCGADSQNCCPGSTCQAALVCIPATGQDRCGPCGTADTPCCADRTCSSGICVGSNLGVCKTECGSDGQACCDVAGPDCANGLGCLGNRCEPCGGVNQPCCPGIGCRSGLGCVGGSCQACGLPEQVCCPGSFGDGCPGPDNECVSGTCQGSACGVMGQACCQGGAGGGCFDGTDCVNDQCVQD